MDLSKYEKMIEQKMEKTDFPISEKELCDRFEKVFTSAVNDVLREEGLLSQALPSGIQPLRESMRVCGVAFTVKGSPSLEIKNEMEYRAEMLEAISVNSLVIWDTSHDGGSAQWGEIMTTAAIKRGCRGAVIDGGVRDTNKILEQNFPVFCKYRTNNGMLGRFRITDYQRPIEIGNIIIYPGDIIFGDIDGVIVIPRALAFDVLIRSEAVRDDEVGIRQMVDSGMKPSLVVKNGGYF